jgi:hypothetical protein
MPLVPPVTMETLPLSVPMYASESVMPALVAGIHVFRGDKADVDGRDKPGHDGSESS